MEVVVLLEVDFTTFRVLRDDGFGGRSLLYSGHSLEDALREASVYAGCPIAIPLIASRR